MCRVRLDPCTNNRSTKMAGCEIETKSGVLTHIIGTLEGNRYIEHMRKHLDTIDRSKSRDDDDGIAER